jgi:hypothetical protein
MPQDPGSASARGSRPAPHYGCHDDHHRPGTHGRPGRGHGWSGCGLDRDACPGGAGQAGGDGRPGDGDGPPGPGVVLQPRRQAGPRRLAARR